MNQPWRIEDVDTGPAESYISLALATGICGTVAFDALPVVIGSKMGMNAAFVGFAAFLYILSRFDRRVFGYAAVLTACNPANSPANLSFSLLLAICIIGQNLSAISEFLTKRGEHPWLSSFVWAFLLSAVGVGYWATDLRGLASELKQALDHIGYIIAFSIAIGMTIRTARDGVRGISLLCIFSIAILAMFYYFGESGGGLASDPNLTMSEFESFKHIGKAELYFYRTCVCIPLAALAVASLVLAVNGKSIIGKLIFGSASGICVLLIMNIASTGSAFAMLCGMIVIGLLNMRRKPTFWNIALVFMIVMIIGAALYVGFGSGDYAISARIDEKMHAGEIDRMVFWIEAVKSIPRLPVGNGWFSLSGDRSPGHSDYLIYWTSYGWLSGALFMISIGLLFKKMWKCSRRLGTGDADMETLLWVGLSVLTVYAVNSILDMLSSNIGYFGNVWALILVPAILCRSPAVEDSARKIAIGRSRW